MWQFVVDEMSSNVLLSIKYYQSSLTEITNVSNYYKLCSITRFFYIFDRPLIAEVQNRSSGSACFNRPVSMRKGNKPQRNVAITDRLCFLMIILT